MFQRYVENVQRLTNPATRQKAEDVRKLMREPRKGFLGCVATRLGAETVTGIYSSAFNMYFGLPSLPTP
jgi:hypothetical protein